MGDYTYQDFESGLQAFWDWVNADPARKAVWSDQTEGGIGTLFASVGAFFNAQVSKAQDFRISELYLQTARLAESRFRIAKSAGYKIPGPSAASVDVLVTIPAQTVAVTLPSMELSIGGHTYSYLGGGVISAGGTTKTVTFSQGEYKTITQSGTGDAYQKVTLTDTGVSDGSQRVFVDNVEWGTGTPKAAVESIGQAELLEETFEVYRNEEGQTIILFGTDTNGKAPLDGTTIEVRWLSTDGAGGRVGSGAFDDETFSWTATETGASIEAALSNAASSAGGTDQPDDASVAQTFIAWLRAVDTGSTDDSWSALALNYYDSTYGRIAKCTPYLVSANTMANIVRLWVACAADEQDLVVAPTGLKTNLLAYMNKRKSITIELGLQDADLVDVDLAAKVKLKTGASEAEATTAIEVAVKALFNVNAVEIGTDVYLSDIYQAIESVEAVEWGIITSHSDNITADVTTGEVLQFGSLTITYQ